MHAPDGFLTADVAAATAVLSSSVVALALRSGNRNSTSDAASDALPMAGMMAAFVFAAQMINVPIAAGTTGHILGGALVAVLIGPRLAVLVMTVVVVAQALLFADGGVTALGYNVLNLAIVNPLVGYGLFRLLARRSRSDHSLAVAAGISAAGAVVATAAAFSAEWALGASAPVPIGRMALAMMSAHTIVALGEGVITTMLIGSVLTARPDLVRGIGANRSGPPPPNRLSTTWIVALGTLAALAIGALLSPFAATAPDALERFIVDNELAYENLSPAPFADYGAGVLGHSLQDSTAGAAIVGFLGVAAAMLLAGAVVAMRQPTAAKHLLSDLAPESRIVLVVGYMVAVALVRAGAFWAFGLLSAPLVIMLVGSWVRRGEADQRQSTGGIVLRLALVLPALLAAAAVALLSTGERPAGLPLPISAAGLTAGATLACRAVLGVLAATALALGTTPEQIGRGLQRLHAPSFLVSVGLFMARYVNLVGGEAERAQQAMVARGFQARWLWQARPMASAAGALVIRSFERSEEIHSAMVSRGFTGSLPHSPSGEASALDPMTPDRGLQWLLVGLAVGSAFVVAISSHLVGR